MGAKRAALTKFARDQPTTRHRQNYAAYLSDFASAGFALMDELSNNAMIISIADDDTHSTTVSIQFLAKYFALVINFNPCL